MNDLVYAPRRTARSRHETVRGLRYHLLEWGDAASVTRERPTLWLLHGWMDVAASFQFVVDQLPGDRHIVAPDWRGFGDTEAPPATDTFFHADYLADLDTLLDAVSGLGTPIDLLGHSLGGNVATMYAGIRPQRIRRLCNIEGFGLGPTPPDEVPGRYAHWLDGLKQTARLADYPSAEAVAERLQKNNPMLAPAYAAWLAPHWARLVETSAGERWAIRANPVHKRIHPIPYDREAAMACWARITAPLLWIEGDRTEGARWWAPGDTLEKFHRRLDVVPNVVRHTLSPASHMVHHDQPQAVASLLDGFLSTDATWIDTPLNRGVGATPIK